MLTTADYKKMSSFVARFLGEGGCLTLARGFSGDDIVADVQVLESGDIDISSNCPEWVGLREIYEHLKWDAMLPSEQAQWLHSASHVLSPEPLLRLEHVTSQLASLLTSVSPSTHISGSAYCFRKAGDGWEVIFRHERGWFPDHRGFSQAVQLLARPNTAIPSFELAGESTTETLELLAAEREQKRALRFEGLTVEQLTKAHSFVREQYHDAIERGDDEQIESAAQHLRQFEEQVGTCEEDFRRRLREKEADKRLGNTFHKSVTKNRERFLKTLRRKGLHECADFLQRSIRAEGWAYAYRPFPPAPDWQL